MTKQSNSSILQNFHRQKVNRTLINRSQPSNEEVNYYFFTYYF